MKLLHTCVITLLTSATVFADIVAEEDEDIGFARLGGGQADGSEGEQKCGEKARVHGIGMSWFSNALAALFPGWGAYKAAARMTSPRFLTFILSVAFMGALVPPAAAQVLNGAWVYPSPTATEETHT